MWQKIKLPPKDELPAELVKLGHKPTSADPSSIGAKKVAVQKQKKKSKRGGRTTNTHMMGILRDYSHMKPGGKA
jgi:transcription initiation factor TFIIE subunit beta